MRILVTGGNGFLGQHLVEKLSTLAHNVIVPSKCDLRITSDCIYLFNNFEPEIVFHLAAKVGGIQANQLYPGQFFYDNMTMGVNVIHQSMIHKVKKLIIVGTTCSYPKFTDIPFVEKSLFDGYPEQTNASYGIAKRALLTMCEAYQQEYGLRYAYLIPTNLYGPGDNFNPKTSHVIPALIKKCLSGQSQIDVWGTGHATRDFLYVSDCVDALVMAISGYDMPEPLNVGSGQEVSIKELLEFVQVATGYNGIVNWDTSRPDGQPRRKLSTSAIESYLGWQPKVNLIDGLKRTVEWYQSTY